MLNVEWWIKLGKKGGERTCAACNLNPDKLGYRSLAKLFSSIMDALISRYSFVRSELLVDWRRSLDNAWRASSSRSFISSHLGESGKKSIPRPSVKAGMIWMASGRRQDASDWPVQMPSWGMSV